MSRIDHIFCSPDLKTLGVEIPRTHLTRLASDHLPLIAELGFAAEAAFESDADGARESRADSLQRSGR